MTPKGIRKSDVIRDRAGTVIYIVRNAVHSSCPRVDVRSVHYAAGQNVFNGVLIMHVSDLQRYGFPAILIDSWTSSTGNDLLPLQEQAIREYGLLEDTNLIISAPTSSGKTFCGEIAIAKALMAGKKAIYLVPLKALAEEKYREFQAKYAPLGLKTIISTGDHRDFDRDLDRGDFNLAIIIFEKLNQLLVRNLDILAFIDLVLVDEMQMISDRSRGAVLELALLKIMRSKYNVRIIGLSAALSGSNALAEWLGGRLMSHRYRPIDLLQGVLWEGCFDYRSQNSGERGSLRILEDDSLEPQEQLFASIRRLLDDNEIILVFLKSKASCSHFAALLSTQINLKPARSAIEKIESADRTSLTDEILELLSNGLAYHHADLSFKQRQAIEDGCRAGEIRVLFATTTLAMGLNLPASTVFLEPSKFVSGCYNQRALAEYLSWPEYENMCGRAGRLSYSDRPGKAILMVSSSFENEVIRARFIDGNPENLNGALANRNLIDIVLDLIASGCCSCYHQIKNALASSYSRLQINDTELDKITDRLTADKWVECVDESLKVTSLGGIISSCSLSVSTAQKLKSLCLAGADFDSLLWIYEFVASAEMNERAMISLRYRPDPQIFENTDSIISSGDYPAFRLVKLLKNKSLIDKTDRARIALCQALCDWVKGEQLNLIEENYRIGAGSLINCAETASWLSESTASMSRCLLEGRSLYNLLRELSFSLKTGLPYAAKELNSRLNKILERDDIMRLFTKGYVSTKRLCECPSEELRMLLGSEKTDAVLGLLNSKKENKNRESQKEEKMKANGNRKLVLDGSTNRDRLNIEFQGRRIPVTMKSFKYLVKLACAKYEDENGWLHKEKLEPGFNQARYIYNLKKELGLARGQGILENNRSGYYRLNLTPEDIALNIENIKGIQDFEIKSLMEKVETLRIGN